MYATVKRVGTFIRTYQVVEILTGRVLATYRNAPAAEVECLQLNAQALRAQRSLARENDRIWAGHH
jgi:hypothetical protein